MIVLEKKSDFSSIYHKKIAFVPTMGCLHQGHLALVEQAKKIAEIVVVSIFINPTQFGKNEDLAKYPKQLKKDLKMLEDLAVDYVFVPKNDEIYPYGLDQLTLVCPPSKIAKKLCGKFRPNHFQGVCTVVLKLLNIVKPNILVLGAKDWQQTVILKKMILDLEIKTEVVILPTVREKSGLALSSRNQYLKQVEKNKACLIFQALQAAKALFLSGNSNIKDIKNEITKTIAKEPNIEIQYLEICHKDTLQSLKKAQKGALIAIAVFINHIRLIDNLIL